MSDETRWTPGPWRVGAYGPNGCYTVGTEQGLMTAMVAHSVNHPGQKDQAVGDAHLIAASPELYEALESMVINANWSVCSRGQMDAAHRALAKARGETS